LRKIFPCKSYCDKTVLINLGITDLNSTLSIIGALKNGSNCFNYVASLIGLLNSENKTDIRLVNDSLITAVSNHSKYIDFGLKFKFYNPLIDFNSTIFFLFNDRPLKNISIYPNFIYFISYIGFDLEFN
jgi:hypothetical protein